MLEILKKTVCEANLELVKYGLVTFTWGNVSGIDESGQYVVIKPSGVEYDRMKPEDMVVTDLNGTVIEGKLKPSSDLMTHLVMYKNFHGIKGIVHTHSRNATSFAQSLKDIQPYGTTHGDYFHGVIPCTRLMKKEEIEGDYELETGKVIVETLKIRDIDPLAVPAVLVASHGPFAWGTDPKNAVHNAVVLEELAYMAHMTENINPETSPMQKDLLDKHFFRKHGEHAYYGQ
ncbi:MAG: L-ribulose-5-phosphate 4-epimerase [Erysipelotrichaceae bacterium]|nr:L-ribulose-5-phosphate 4-epimerase [Erysipelotrichaceae bacterium]